MLDRISVLARRRRIRNLEQWTLYAIFAEAFFLALSPQIAAAAVMVGVVTWFLRSQIDSHYKMRSLPFDVPVTIFLLIGAASVMFSSVRSLGLIYNYCALVGIYGLTYLIVGQTIEKPEHVKHLAQALFASATLVVLVGLFQIVFGVDAADVKWTDPEAFPQLKKRIFSTLENPNVLAGYLDVMICLALGLLAKVEQRIQKIILLVGIVAMAGCLTMTYSRGAFMTMVIIFVVYGVLQDWRVLILFAVATGLIAFNDPTFVERISSTFNMGDSSEGVRVGIWVSTTAMISDHPFTGIGWGAYQYVYPQYNYYIADPNITIYHAHNIYLNFAAEVGIVGALAFFWYFFGTTLMTLGLKERFAKLRGVDDDSSWDSETEKVTAKSNFLQTVAELKAVVESKFALFADGVMNLLPFGKKRTLKIKRPRKSYREVVHHGDMKWSDRARKKFADEDNLPDAEKFSDGRDEVADDEKVTSIEKMTVGGEKISVKRIKLIKFPGTVDANESATATKSLIDLSTLTTLDDKKFIDGFKLGLGLAFLSMALNGLTDDLLFNIPSAMLMWQLGATAAAIHLMKFKEA